MSFFFSAASRVREIGMVSSSHAEVTRRGLSGTGVLGPALLSVLRNSLNPLTTPLLEQFKDLADLALPQTDWS
jgi:hypothetical protein